jgi:hypothetical protein
VRRRSDGNSLTGNPLDMLLRPRSKNAKGMISGKTCDFFMPSDFFGPVQLTGYREWEKVASVVVSSASWHCNISRPATKMYSDILRGASGDSVGGSIDGAVNNGENWND